jgi:cytochrome P450
MDRWTPMAAAAARRVRVLLSGALALAVLTGGSFYLARSVFSPGPAARWPAPPAATAQMAAGLTQSMLSEQPPDDGHRRNILSSTFTHIGIAVYRDSSGTVWLTQDFSN